VLKLFSVLFNNVVNIPDYIYRTDDRMISVL